MWEFAILLVAALIGSSALSYRQSVRYRRRVNELAHQHKGEGRYLVSGRAKGRLRGAVVVLVIDTGRQGVVAAETMTGASTFARLTPDQRLCGPLGSLLDRAPNATMRTAIETALAQLPRPTKPTTTGTSEPISSR
ncbi:MAG: transcriptional regulator GutM [Actinomycetales bacterium]